MLWPSQHKFHSP